MSQPEITIESLDWTKPLAFRDGRRAKILAVFEHKLTPSRPQKAVVTRSPEGMIDMYFRYDCGYVALGCQRDGDIINVPPETTHAYFPAEERT